MGSRKVNAAAVKEYEPLPRVSEAAKLKELNEGLGRDGNLS